MLHFGFKHAHHKFACLHNDFQYLHCRFIILFYDFYCQQLKYDHVQTCFSLKTGDLAFKPAM